MGPRTLLPLAFVTAALCAPASALAAQGSLSCDSGGQNCTMVYTGDTGEDNAAVVTTGTIFGSTPAYEVHDPGVTQITPQPPCQPGADAQTMDCPQDVVVAFSASLGDGSDTISVQVNLPSSIGAGAGNDTINGGPASDTSLRGGDGNDTINGGGGDDVLWGDNTDNVGPGGNDTLRGGDGNDTFNGEAGDDTFVAEAASDGADTLNGGAGVDTASFAARTAPQTLSIDGVANDGVGPTPSDNIEPDVENVVGGSGPDTITGSSAANRLDGGGGDDSIAAGEGDDVANGGDGTDVEDGGSGADQLRGDGGNDTLMGDAGADNLGGGDGDDSLAGGDDPDTLAGDAGNDRVDGGGGSDSVSGGADSDTLAGDADADALDGGSGDDSLDGGAGADALAGGDGVDLATYASRAAGVTVSLDGKPGDGEPGEGDDVEADVENVTGGSGPDTFFGSAAANTLDGGAGEDYEDGGAGADTLVGGDAGDVFRTRGSTQAATITCGPGPDFVVGKAADKTSGDCDRVDRGVRQRPKRRTSVVVKPAAGTLQMSPTGIVRGVPLQDKVVLPVGSGVDSVSGTVTVTSAPKAKRSESIKLYAGAFDITQTSGKLAVTQFGLEGGDFSACTAARRGPKPARAAASKTIRKLWATGKGRFRTRGRYAAAVVRGTKWLTEDRCDGTLVRVASGAVTVRDFVAKRTVVVRAGRSYLARRR